MRTMRRLLLALMLLFSATPAMAAQPAKKEILPFIHDDFAGALAQAKSKKVPIFVEAWAPW